MAALAQLTNTKGMSDSALKGASILILEDELLLRKHLAAVLEQQDADVTAIGTVDGARRIVNSIPFDFALLDINLPDGLGTDLLKEGIFSPNTAVLVCTAEGGIKGAVEALRNGAQDYLLKLIDPNVLPMVLQRAKNSRQSARLVEHELERAIVFEDGDELELPSLPNGSEKIPNNRNINELLNKEFEFPKDGFSLEDTIDKIIQNAIDQSGGNVSAAARLLDVPRDYIRYRQKKSGE